MVFSSLSLPKEMIWPATCAPTSTTSTGSIVPVAVIVAMRAPRFTAATRKEDLGLFRACTHQLPTAMTKRVAPITEAVLLSANHRLTAAQSGDRAKGERGVSNSIRPNIGARKLYIQLIYDWRALKSLSETASPFTGVTETLALPDH